MSLFGVPKIGTLWMYYTDMEIDGLLRYARSHINSDLLKKAYCFYEYGLSCGSTVKLPTILNCTCMVFGQPLYNTQSTFITQMAPKTLDIGATSFTFEAYVIDNAGVITESTSTTLAYSFIVVPRIAN